MGHRRDENDAHARALRELAERRVAAAPPVEVDLAKLVHELQVHQIELEMQNDELTRTRGALEDSLERYTDLYDFAPIGYLTLGRGGELRELNLAAARLLGVERAQAVGRALPPMLSAASRPVLARFLVELIDGPARCLVEPAAAPGHVVRLQGTRAEEGISLRIVAEDVTELRRVELERDRLALTVRQLEESVFITDVDGRIVFVNPAFEQASLESAAAVLGRPPRVLESGGHEAAFYARLWATLRAGEVWRGRLLDHRKDGSSCTLQATLSPLRDEHGVVTHYVAVLRDVSDELAREEQLQQSRRLEAIGQLAGGVAHDFNNLLLVIKSSAEFAAQSLPPEASARAEVAQIEHAADRAASLTRQLLAFSCKQVLRPERVDLDALAASTTRMLRRVLGERLQLRQRPSGGLWKVRADPGQIEQILMNLGLNARDAMPRGGELVFETANVTVPEPRVGDEPEAAPVRDFVRLTVADTGCGMPPEIRARIFEPFFSTKPKEKGTGLGLSTVYGIMQQSGGFVTCASEVGRGTVFSLFFPRHLEEATPGDGEAPAPSSARAEPAADEPRATVMVVEDEPNVRTVVRRILHEAGYEVLVAHHGAEALALCDEHAARVALVLSDVVMPVMGGSELKRRLAVSHPTIELVFMSGYAEDLAEAAQGEVSVLAKPFSASSLLAKVAERLAARRARLRAPA